ncbi:MAG: NifU family protein [Acidimicrobiales bacterium]
MPETSPIAATDIDEPAPGAPVVADPGSGADGADGSNDARGGLFDAVAQVVKIIRPAIQADQGDIFLKGVDEASGVVSVELVGACVSCPASTQTLKQGLERILKQRVEGVTEVRHVGEPLAGADEGTAVSL